MILTVAEVEEKNNDVLSHSDVVEKSREWLK
jgi:hypothetical protein